MINNGYITFKKDTHQYFNPDNVEHISMSRVLDRLKKPFDPGPPSYYTAKGILSKQGITSEAAIQKKAAEIREEWKTGGQEAADEGTYVHDQLEAFDLQGYCDNKAIERLGKRLHNEVFKDYYKTFKEEIFHSKKFKIAGTGDKTAMRKKIITKNPIFDIFDYKTNKEMTFDSIKREDGKLVKHNDRFCQSPFQYLEECKYTGYSFQLSGYAAMLQEMMDCEIGLLKIIHIWKKDDGEYDYKLIPCNYMKNDVVKLFGLATQKTKSLKQLPEVNNKTEQEEKPYNDF